ncbi:MAG TPA: CBS domain-containing protein [Polyangiales bacterium]
MPQKIREIMTPNPVMLNVNATVGEAAQTMRDRDIGCILVTDASNRLCGLVTDRDLVVRGVAEGKDPRVTTLQEVCSEAITELTPDDTVDNAIKLMAKKHIRRIPIMEGARPVGVLSLGDLALERDPDSVLSRISSAAPNN